MAAASGTGDPASPVVEPVVEPVVVPVGAGQVAALVDALIIGREFPSELLDRMAEHAAPS